MKKIKQNRNFIFKIFDFLGFGNKEKETSIDEFINNDPRIAKLDKEMGDLNRQSAARIKSDPYLLAMFKKAGVDID